jgi:hypothetical protein
LQIYETVLFRNEMLTTKQKRKTPVREKAQEGAAHGRKTRKKHTEPLGDQGTGGKTKLEGKLNRV